MVKHSIKMVSVYVGLRFPVATYSGYERIVVNNVHLSLNSDPIKEEVAKKVKIPAQEIGNIFHFKFNGNCRLFTNHLQN